MSRKNDSDDKKNNNNGSGRDYSKFDNPPSYYRNAQGAKPSERSSSARISDRENSKQPEQPRRKKRPSSNVVDIEPKIRQRQAKSKTSRTDLFVLTVCLVLFTLSVGGSLFKFLTQEHVATMVVPHGSVDLPRIVNGIIIREETLYQSGAEGEVVYSVANLEKVKKGSMVCSIENPSDTMALAAQSQELSKKIIEMQSMRGDVSSVSSDIHLINNKMKDEIDSSLLKMSSADITPLYGLKEALNLNIKLRNEKLLSENNSAAKQLVDEYRQYTGKIDESRAPIIAEQGGIVSYSIDGFEDVLTLENIKDITKEQTTMTVKSDVLSTKREVKPDDTVFKIIESNNWYIAAYIENDLVYEWGESNNVRLYIDKNGDYIAHSFKIDTLRKGETESYVILKSDKQLLDFLDMRTVSFKTYDSVHSGIKIPESAICERTFLKIPLSFVYEIRDNSVVNKKIGDSMEQVKINTKTLRTALYEEGYVYIMQDFDNIRRGDTIVMENDPEQVYVIDEIVTSSGIFRTNTGLATFVSINTDGMVRGNKGYVILDSSGNNGGVKLYDRIVTDVAGNFVREGDIIK